MPNKLYKMSENEPITVTEISYQDWNPNIPFHGTQEEWWEHFHQIEQGRFNPVSETHQRISQWLNQKM